MKLTIQFKDDLDYLRFHETDEFSINSFNSSQIQEIHDTIINNIEKKEFDAADFSAKGNNIHLS